MTIDNIFSEMGKNRAAWAKQMAAIRDRDDLSETGKRQELGKGYAKAMEKHKQLMADYREHITAARATLEPAAFAPTFPALATTGEKQQIRQALAVAMERLDGKDSREFGGLLERAKRTEDTLTPLAIANILYERDAEVGRIVEAVPHRADQIKALYEFDATHGQKQNRNTKLAIRMHTTSPTRPQEIFEGDMALD